MRNHLMAGHRRTLLAFVLPAAMLPVLALSPAAATAGAPTTLAPLRQAAAGALADRYIVVLKPDVKQAGIAPAVARARTRGVTIEYEYRHALDGFAARLDAAQLKAVRSDPDVAYIEEQQVFRADVRDTTSLWNLDRIDQRLRPGDGAYNYQPTGSGVDAFVIDTGIRRTHREFGGRAVAGFSAINDGRGTDDCNGHGTHVAGTVGGTTYGVAKQVRLVAVRVLDCTGVGTVGGVIAGVDWGTGNRTRASVANMSLGGSASAALDAAVARSIASGVTYVLAAGNDGVDACTASPARLGPAITVAASDRTDVRSRFQGGASSNFGPCVDLFAPGSDVLSAWFTSDQATNVLDGTSMAAPHVAGTAALHLQSRPSADPAQVRTAIVGGATNGVLTDPGPGSPNLLLYTHAPADHPFGAIYDHAPATGGIRISGWTVDPDTAAPISVHMYVDGVPAGGFVANRHRPDIGNAFPAYGPNHGFDETIAVGQGTHEVCVYAINVGLGSDNPALGCRTVVVSPEPFGNLDGVEAGTGGIRFWGWAIDPDTTAPISVHPYIDGVANGGFAANRNRSDIGAAYPQYGANHGFDEAVAAGRGVHSVCVYAINAGPGTTNRLLGCKTVTVG